MTDVERLKIQAREVSYVLCNEALERTISEHGRDNTQVQRSCKQDQFATRTNQSAEQQGARLMAWRIYVDCSKPGKNTGWAIAKNTVLVLCNLWNNDFAPVLDCYGSCEKIVIEVPQINPNDLKKPGASARINDLMQLAICAGQWKQAVRALETRIVHPHEWKGSVPKDVHNARVFERMSTAERALLPKLPPSKLHNVIDAVGLYMWDTERMRP